MDPAAPSMQKRNATIGDPACMEPRQLKKCS
jgi:hypothetical protein